MEASQLTSLPVLTIITIFGILQACATPPRPPVALSQNQPADIEGHSHLREAVMNTGKSVPSAVQAPLRDLNIMRSDIPNVLSDIDYPYRIDGPIYCDELIEEINALNAVLGTSADIDARDLSQSEKAAESASNAAQSAMEDAATGWIPYRSVLRRVTGATAHEREVRQAFEAGRIRRAFLKGVGGAFQCPYPARPLSVIAPQIISEGNH